MTELLPCPFCGGEAKRIDIEDGNNAGGSCVVCTQCDASSNVEFEFKENFVSNWNQRFWEDDVRTLAENIYSALICGDLDYDAELKALGHALGKSDQ